MLPPFRIGCQAIEYRQGFIEVQPLIHPGLVNLEVWMVDPDIDLTNKWVSDDAIPDEKVTDNVELELTPSQARSLANSLLEFATIAEKQTH